MTNNDELAMKAESIIADMKRRHKDIQIYAPIMTWSEFESLLAERDADKIQLDELESKLSQSESWSLAAQKYIAYLESQAKQLVAESDADKKRIAELEARTVSVKLPPCVDDLHGVGMVMSADAVVEALTDAGIKLEVGE